MLGAVVLIVAAILVTLSATRPPAPALVDLSWPSRPDFSILNQKNLIPVTGSEAGLAIYSHSERVEAYPANINDAGLAQYHLSERESYLPTTNSLENYYRSERLLAYPVRENEAGLAIYHQSEWFGK